MIKSTIAHPAKDEIRIIGLTLHPNGSKLATSDYY